MDPEAEPEGDVEGPEGGGGGGGREACGHSLWDNFGENVKKNVIG